MPMQVLQVFWHVSLTLSWVQSGCPYPHHSALSSQISNFYPKRFLLQVTRKRKVNYSSNDIYHKIFLN